MATSAETLRRTNEAPGTRAKLRNLRISAYKVREVLDLIRGQDVQTALEILETCERGAAVPVSKLLDSAIANAVENDEQQREDLFVSACFADEGPTMKRFKPRARGRAGRIRKRSSHVTIIVARLPEDRLERLREKHAQDDGGRRRVFRSRAERVAKSKQEASEEVVDETSVDTADMNSESDVTETAGSSSQTDVVDSNDENVKEES